MKTLYSFQDKIYESPDGGKTIYQRTMGSTERILVGQNLAKRLDPMTQLKYNITFAEFIHICQLAENNQTLGDCFSNLLSTYNLIKNNE